MKINFFKPVIPGLVVLNWGEDGANCLIFNYCVSSGYEMCEG